MAMTEEQRTALQRAARFLRHGLAQVDASGYRRGPVVLGGWQFNRAETEAAAEILEQMAGDSGE